MAKKPRPRRPPADAAPRPARRRRPLLRFLLNLFALYAAYHALVVCPARPAGPAAPLVCRALDHSHALLRPRLLPLYDAYAARYVDRLRPCAHFAHRHYAPLAASAHSTYWARVHPLVLRAQKQALKDYRTAVQPVLDRHLVLPCSTLYAKHLQAHVAHAHRFYSHSLAPLAVRSSARLASVYRVRLVPAYNHIAPRLCSAAVASKNTYLAHAHPKISTALAFCREKLHSLVFVQLRLLWNQHVQPQLDKIHDRVFQFRADRQLSQNVNNGAENESFAQHSESFAQYSDPLADHSEPLADRSEPLADHFDPLADHSESLATQAKKEAERKHIDSTINTAASVLAKATTTAEDKLVAEITDILQAAERKESRVCNDYLHQLQELCNTTISSIEKKILVLAAMDTNLDHRLQQLDSLSLDAIASIKDKTIQISEYSNNIFPHLHQRISNDIHAVTKQLDEIRINLQEEIGREWPYLDYVTYKDWAKYHALRTDLHSRQKEFVEFLELQTKPAHSNLEEIPINVQDQIDEISSLAFKKIEMVQFVGAKKIRTKDTKNDFPQNYMSFTESVYENIKAAPGVAVSKASQAIYGVQETFGPEEIYEKYIGSAADFIQSAANAAGQAGQAAYQEGIEYIKENVVPAAAETGQNSGQGGQAAFEKAEFAKENVLPLVSEYAQDASKQIKSQANAATEAVQSKGEQIREKISSAALGPIAESRSSAATEPGFVEHAISGFDQKVDETTHFAQHIVQDLKDKTDQVYEKASDFIDKAPAADILPKNVDDKVLKAKVFIPSSDPERNSKSPRAQKFDGEL